MFLDYLLILYGWRVLYQDETGTVITVMKDY